MNADGNSEILSAPVRTPRQIAQRLVELLVRDNHLTRDEADEMVKLAAWHQRPVECYAVAETGIDAAVVLKLTAEISGLPLGEGAMLDVDPSVVERVPPDPVLDHHVMPLRVDAESGLLLLATDHVLNPNSEDDLRLITGHSLSFVLCPTEWIDRSIRHFYGLGIEAFLGRRSGDGDPDIAALVEEIITEAVRSRATDIHFEPYADTLRLRLRIDGALATVPLPAGVDDYKKALVSSIKAMAELDLAEHRKPQDGRFDYIRDGEAFDLRVSILPSAHGEAANLRLLNRQATFLDLNQLGFREEQEVCMRRLLGLSHGMILFCGPTGSGKTTSLYAALERLNDDETKIITLEDPIEYEIEGITQMQVNHRIDFTFSTGLRSILRHDPDVVLVGEIRDGETAEIAVSAALTGHQVFSSLHTNDSAGAIPRLIDMGIEPYLVASSLEGIIAQRLVRSICRRCREPVVPPHHQLEEIADELQAPLDELVFFQGRGCPACMYTGYLGRLAVFEFMEMDEPLRAMAVERSPSNQLMAYARKRGMRTLREHGWERVREGDTTISEVLRVTQRNAEDPQA